MKEPKAKGKLLALVPNLITYANMTLGFAGIFVSMGGTQEKVKLASLLVLLAAVTDKLDGYLARRWQVASDFGRELDSLCDLLSFGMAPVLIGWNMNKGIPDIPTGLASLIFLGAGIFRLARFNISPKQPHITGLPITIGGMVLVTKYLWDIYYRTWALESLGPRGENQVIMILLAIMMASKVKFKKPF